LREGEHDEKPYYFNFYYNDQQIKPSFCAGKHSKQTKTQQTKKKKHTKQTQQKITIQI
jgi:hypothetical protein